MNMLDEYDFEYIFYIMICIAYVLLFYYSQ